MKFKYLYLQSHHYHIQFRKGGGLVILTALREVSKRLVSASFLSTVLLLSDPCQLRSSAPTQLSSQTSPTRACDGLMSNFSTISSRNSIVFFRSALLTLTDWSTTSTSSAAPPRHSMRKMLRVCLLIWLYSNRWCIIETFKHQIQLGNE